MRKNIDRTNNSVVLFLIVLAVALVSLPFFGPVGWSANYRTSTVQPTQIVPVDIKPGFCPNQLEVAEGGVVSIAILGTDRLDVKQIALDSVRVEEMPPEKSSFKDVATPHRLYHWKASRSKVRADYCTDEGPDGKLDLVLEFQMKDILKAKGALRDGDVIVLRLIARDRSGTSLVGQDVVVISE